MLDIRITRFTAVNRSSVANMYLGDYSWIAIKSFNSKIVRVVIEMPIAWL